MPAPNSEASSALTSALKSPWPSLRFAAATIIHQAILRNETLGGAADELGIGRRTLERLRAKHPEIFTLSKTAGHASE